MERILFSYLLIILIPALGCGGEFQVNTHTSNKQENAAIAMDANSNFVAVWSSYLQDGNSNGIFGQRFDTNCSPVGDEFPVNTTTIGNQKMPAVAMDSAGNFVVVWHGPGVSEEDIFARRFEPNGTPLADEFRVNSRTDSRQLSPGAAMNDNGKLIIVWESLDIADPCTKSIRGQVYDISGAKIGDELLISDEQSVCRFPDVVINDTNLVIVAWTGQSSLNSVHVRHFQANGNEPNENSVTPTQVNKDNFSSLTKPSIAVDANGNYAIVWDGHPDTYLEDDVYLRRYHWSHFTDKDEQPILVNTYQSGAQRNPSVAMSGDGRFVVVWESDTGTTQKDIFGQRFASAGEYVATPVTVGEQFRINTYTLDEQERPAAAMSDSGSFVTIWQSDGQDGAGLGIFGDIGPKVGCADFTEDGFVDSRDYCVLGDEWLKDQNPLTADLIDDNKIDGQDLAGFCEQWLRPCYECSEVDINNDGRIDFRDYGFWADNWSKEGPGLIGDFTANGTVNFEDLRALLFHWVKSCN